MLRLSIFNANTSVLETTLTTRFDIYNGTGHQWVAAPGPGILVGTFGSTLGHRAVAFLGGNYTLFGLVNTGPPLPNNAIGNQNVRFVAEQDLFYTLYYVPRTMFSLTSQRAIVLTWNSQLPNTVFVNLNLVIAKYDPTTFTCTLAPCCLADPTTGPCGVVNIPHDSLTSDNVEEAFFSDLERTSSLGPYYSYLVYVQFLPPGSGAQLKLSNAQLRTFSQASAKDYEAAFDLTFTPAQLADITFVPTYWPAFCMKRDLSGIISYKDLKNTSSSASSIIQPTAAAYCT
jgi:hypothetical protein